MAILDGKGRLFGKFNVLDIGAVLVIVMVIVGVLLPSTAQQFDTGNKPVELDVIVRGFAINGQPQPPVKEGDETSLIIRNQPFGKVTVKSVTPMSRTVVVPQPDGGVKAMPDPRPEASYTQDFLVTLTGKAEITKDGPVLGGSKVKAGSPVEIEGFTYNFPNLIVQDVRVPE